MKEALLYFVKYPEPGKVKTRLGKTIGYERAADKYRALAQRNFDLLLSLPLDTAVYFDPADKKDAMAAWLPEADVYLNQREGSLTERLQYGFSEMFSRGYDRVYALGSDTLDLTARLIEEAQVKLNRNDCVIGPARDGGYYLIGLKKDRAELFEGISWSSAKVYDETLLHLKAHNMSYEILPYRDDLDDAEVLKKRGEWDEVKNTA